MSQIKNNEGITHKEFFEKALTSAGEWTRFADPKVLGVAVFLSFGVTDLLRHAGDLYHGLSSVGALEWVTTVCFMGACLCALTTVMLVSGALFPRFKPKGPKSLLFFGSVAEFDEPEEYEREVKNKTPQELEKQIAHQAWNVARTANTKYRWTWWAYFSLLAFLAFWVVARLALSLGS